MDLDYGFLYQKALECLSINCIYSKFICLSKTNRDYFRDPSNLNLLTKLIGYDFPLLFMLSSSFEDKLRSSSNINMLIKQLYTNFAQTVHGYSSNSKFGNRLSDDNKTDQVLKRNLLSIIQCGGILGIKYYINHISKTKNIPIECLYIMPIFITLHKPPQGVRAPVGGINIDTFQKLSQNELKSSSKNPYNKPIHIEKWFVQSAFSTYLRLFDVDGSIINADNKTNYVKQFRLFLIHKMLSYHPWATNYKNDCLWGILETELVNIDQFDDALLLFKLLFQKIFKQNQICVPVKNSRNRMERHSCMVVEEEIIKTLICLPNKKSLQQCYDCLFDESSVLFNIVSEFNKHLILCWGAAEGKEDFEWIGGGERIEINTDMGEKIIKRYSEILYQNFHPSNREIGIKYTFDSDYVNTMFGVPMPQTRNKEARMRWISMVQNQFYKNQ
eukprot:498484_1